MVLKIGKLWKFAKMFLKSNELKFDLGDKGDVKGLIGQQLWLCLAKQIINTRLLTTEELEIHIQNKIIPNITLKHSRESPHATKSKRENSLRFFDID